MKCITCKTIMICIDDVNEISTSIDFVKCPKCGPSKSFFYSI